MKNLLVFTTGAAVGYVLGARAGRPAYDRLVEMVGGMTNGMPRTRNAVQDTGADLRDATADLRESADSRLAGAVQSLGDTATSAAAQAGGTHLGAMGSSRTGSSGISGTA